jgi:hypothetical protein
MADELNRLEAEKTKKIWWLHPPEGCEFRPCDLCGNPKVCKINDPEDKTCIWCQINESDEDN